MQYFLVFVVVVYVLTTIFSSPVIWLLLGIVVIFVIAGILDLFNTSSNNTRQSSSYKTSNQSVKNTGKFSSFKEWSQSVDKNEPNKKSDDMLDEKISVKEFIKLRDVLNSIDLSGEFTEDTRDEIIEKLLAVKSSEFDNETATRLENIDLNTARNFFVSYRDMLNSKDLEAFDFVTARDFMLGFATEEEMQDAVERENSRNQTSQVYDDYDDYDEYDEDDEYDDDNYEKPNWKENSNSAKQKRIKNLRKDVNRLNREYRFESGFDPDWDEDDRLSEKYRHDEEKYLRARKLELEERNRSYDNYLAPDERDRFKDETDEEW